MNKTGFIFKSFGRGGTPKTALTLILAVFIGLLPLYGAENQRNPIIVNLIIDGSASFSEVKDEITSWVLSRLDAILVDGDTVTIWSAGSPSRVIYTGRINGASDRDVVKNSIRALSGSGEIADFSGALRDAASRQSSSFSYTLLISASGASLSSVLAGPQANLLRYSRVEEFTTWRALTVGLNIDIRVRRAAAAFIGQ
jgi:hypothetical protein